MKTIYVLAVTFLIIILLSIIFLCAVWCMFNKMAGFGTLPLIWAIGYFTLVVQQNIEKHSPFKK